MPHTPLATSHASPLGQSLALVQPHVPLERQAVPEGLVAHDAQAAPVAPHAAFAVPGAHVPALQQPPLQGWLDEQTVVQA